MMDIIKGTTVQPEIKKILIVGVEKSGKTTFISTMPKPILIFEGESGAETRLGGIEGIDFVRCFDNEGEPIGSGMRRFERIYKSTLLASTPYYKTIAIDPISFLSDYIVADIDRTNPGIKGSANTFQFWNLIKMKHIEILGQMLSASEYVVVISHVRLILDETTGKEMFLPDLNGSIRDSIGGWFDAVLFAKTTPTPTGAKYSLLALPDGTKKCGIRVPLGHEHLLTKEVEPSYTRIVEQLNPKISGEK